MKKKIIFSMSCIALLSILLSMVLSGVVSYYDSLEIVKKATIAESRYIQNGIALGGDDYLSDIRSHSWKRFTPSSPNLARLFSAFSILFSLSR